MAKITPSILVSNFSGTLGGSTFKKNAAGILVKKTTTPRRPRSEDQQNRKGYLTELSRSFYALTDIEKAAWNKYASLVHPHASGFNLYMSLNMNIYDSRTGVFTKITSPPLTPSTPDAIEGLAWTAPDDWNNVLTWTYPLDPSLYVVIHYAFMAGYSIKNKQTWRFLSSVSADTGTVTHTHTFPVGTIFNYHAYTVDASGRKSPPAVVLSNVKFLGIALPGVYGSTKYGFSYYGS